MGFDIVAPASANVVSDKPDEPDPEAPAFIFQTSGTSGEPKLIPFSHRNMLVAAIRLQAWYELTRKIAVLASPLSFIRTG